MSSLVFIKEIRRDSFLHFSTKRYADGESYALRDFAYNNSPILTQITSSYSADDIRAMAKKSGNHYLANIPHRTVVEVEFWREEIARQNQKYGITQQPIVNSLNVEQTCNEKHEEIRQSSINFEKNFKVR